MFYRVGMAVERVLRSLVPWAGRTSHAGGGSCVQPSPGLLWMNAAGHSKAPRSSCNTFGSLEFTFGREKHFSPGVF